MKKAMKFLFNLFWVLTVGLASAISSGIMGIACCVTIIGIPLGLQHFKFIPLVFAPEGKRVALRYGSHPVLNTLWLIFGGLEAFVLYCALGVACSMTIIGAPIAAQLFKIARFNLAPFGSEVVKEYHYSSKKNTGYDYNLLSSYVAAEPNRQMEDGKTVKEHLLAMHTQFAERSNRKKLIMGVVTVFEMMITILLALKFAKVMLEKPSYILFAVVAIVWVMASWGIRAIVTSTLTFNTMKSTMGELFVYYPGGERVPQINAETLLAIINEGCFDAETTKKKIKEYAIQDINNWKTTALLGIVLDLLLPVLTVVIIVLFAL